MGKYLDEFTKQALWEAHNKKCFYCKEVLLFKNIHLDHVIPQCLYTKEEKDLRKKYILDLPFKFNSVDNIVPACQSCNSMRKKGKELENGIPLWLDEIKEKKEYVKINALKLKKELTLDLPDQYKEFLLSSPSFLLFNLRIDRIQKKDIPLYKEMVFSDGSFPLSLISPVDGREVSINTLKLYQEYSHKGYYALSTPAMNVASLCHACLVFFEMLEKASTIKHKIDFKDYFRDLPIDILFGTCFEDQEKLLRKYKKIGRFIETNVIGTSKELNFSKNSLHITENHKEFNEKVHYIIREILQADFTGKNNNEALLFIFYQSAGTMCFYYPCLVSYYDSKWHLEKIQSKIPLN